MSPTRAAATRSVLGSLVGLALLVAPLAPAPARAEAPLPPWHHGVGETQKALAQQHLEEGNRLVRMGLIPPGVRAYRRALAQWDHPGLHVNLAKALMNLDRVPEALLHLLSSLRHGVAGLGPTFAEQVERYIRVLIEAELVHLVVESRRREPIRLGDRVILSGPGRWEGVIAAGPITLRAGDGSGPGSARDTLRLTPPSGHRLALTWSETGTHEASARPFQPDDITSLSRSTLGFGVRLPTAEELRGARDFDTRVALARLQARLPPRPERSAEARRLCERPHGELVELCRAWDSDLSMQERLYAEAMNIAREAARRLAEIQSGGLVEALD